MTDHSPEGQDESEEPPAESGDRPDEPEDGPTVESLLRTAGVLDVTPDGSDVRLTAAFERALSERIEQLRGGDRAVRWLAAARGIDPVEVTATAEDDRFVVTHDGETIGAWHSEAGFLAAVAAEPTIREWVDEERLAALPDEARAELAARLVICLERCPTCDGSLSFVDREDDGTDEIALTCSDCRAVVATAPGESASE